MAIVKETRRMTLAGRQINVEVYRDEGVEVAPGILYLHELFGLLNGYRDDARELAAQGYLVYLPDLFSGDALGYCVRALVAGAGRRNQADNQPNREVNELLDQLKADPHCSGRLGMLGMCLTGGFVIQAAMRDDMEAPVVYHHSLGMSGAGIPRREEAGLAQVKRMQGHWSKRDPMCPKSRRERLGELLGDRLETHLYSVPHGFRSVSRGTRQARQAWERTLQFYSEHLLGATAT